MAFFTETENPKICIEPQRVKASWRVVNKARGIILLMPPHQTILQSYIIKTVYWHKETSVVQNREPRNKPHIHGQLTYDKGDENV